jgi:hypothetical protein
LFSKPKEFYIYTYLHIHTEGVILVIVLER